MIFVSKSRCCGSLTSPLKVVAKTRFAVCGAHRVVFVAAIGVFELPAIQCLAIVAVIIIIGVHGSLPEEVVKHFHDSGPLSTVISKKKLLDLISLAVLGLGCFLARLELKCLHFLELEV